jgi:hypothetical protein
MFQQVCEMVSGITALSDGKDYDAKTHKKFVSTLEYKHFDGLLQLINSQNAIKKPSYSIYKMDLKTWETELVDYVFDASGNEYHTCIDVTDGYLVLNTLTPACLAEYIRAHEKMGVVFLSFNYSCAAKEAGHQAAIMINIKTKRIYLMDPNGSPTYFNNIFEANIDVMLEKMLHNYFAELKSVGYEFRYEFIGSWNKGGLYLNGELKNEYIGSGHCVIWTFILAHLISHNKYSNPIEAYKLLTSLSEEERLYIIKEYTMGVFCLFRSA